MQKMLGLGFIGLSLVAGCGGGGSASPEEACANFCDFAAECADEFGIGDPASCSTDCLPVAEQVGAGCLDALGDTITCLDTCDFDTLTEADARRCEGEGRRFLNKCENLL